jgi:uncharacterized protein YbjT (DUF2867 family)
LLFVKAKNMKYVITGSLGHISRPVTEALITAGHPVTVISSQQDRTKEIESLNAAAAIGSVEDQDFISTTFSKADAVYLMIPPNFITQDFPGYQKKVADNYVNALKNSNVQYIVLLSSIGAHLRKGAGPIDALGYLEEQLQLLPQKDIKILRPAFFLYNFLRMAPLLKTHGIIGGNYGNEQEKIALVHHLDIADCVIKHLRQPSFTGYSIEYIVSDEQYVADIASVLGKVVDKPTAQWVTFTDEQTFDAMTQQGLHSSLVKLFVEMGTAFRDGRIQEDYWKQPNVIKDRRTLEKFANEFAAVYNSL